jgi:hypothetical protein
MVFFLTAGQRHEAAAFEPLMEQGAVKRVGRGRPRQRHYRVIGDKGYGNGEIRRYLQRVAMILICPQVSGTKTSRTDPSMSPHMCIMRCGSLTLKFAVTFLATTLLAMSVLLIRW